MDVTDPRFQRVEKAYRRYAYRVFPCATGGYNVVKFGDPRVVEWFGGRGAKTRALSMCRLYRTAARSAK